MAGYDVFELALGALIARCGIDIGEAEVDSSLEELDGGGVLQAKAARGCAEAE